MTTPRGPVPPHYNPERLRREAAARGLAFARRQLIFYWALVRALIWVVLVVRSPGNKPLKLAFARWARLTMVELGAVYIKLGQLLSTRVDAFSPEVLAELAQLQDKVPPFPFSEARAIIEADLGAPLETLFAHFDEAPLAAASMGQVHCARLADGSDIVVKILRPGLEARFIMDITLMRGLAGWLGRHPRLLARFGGSTATPWVGLVDKLAVSLYQQLDLWQEGLSGERFARNFADHPRVKSPAIYWSHTSTRVLAQERIYGFRFDEDEAIKAAGIDYREVAEIVIRAFTKQVFEDRFFHADSHPGNLWITPEGNVVYLDFGMVEEVREDLQASLVQMLSHAVQQDWAGMLEDLVRAGIVPDEVPRAEVLPLFTEVWSAQLGHSTKRYTLQDTSDVFYDVIRRYPFRMPEDFLFITRTSTSLEGVVYRVDPGFKFMTVALPYFAKWMLSRVDVENPLLIREMLSAARDGALVRLMSEMMSVAVSDEPERMADVVAGLVEVTLHPRSGPLRDEMREIVLSGGLDGVEGLIPAGFTLGTRALAAIRGFLRSSEGRAYCVGLLEDARFPALAAKVLQAKALPIELPIDWVELFLHWFPSGSERQRAFRLVQGLLASPDFPWSQMVRDPFGASQLTSTVPRAEHLPALLEFLGQRGTLPLLARGVVKGWTSRLTGAATGPLPSELGPDGLARA